MRNTCFNQCLIYFFFSFRGIFLFLCIHWFIILKKRSYFLRKYMPFNFYIRDYNIFIKEFYTLIFFFLISIYSVFFRFYISYKIISRFPKYKGVYFVFYLLCSIHFFTFIVSQTQTFRDVLRFVETNKFFRKSFSNYNLISILFNFKGYFYDLFFIIAFWYICFYIFIFCIFRSKSRDSVIQKNKHCIFWVFRVRFYSFYFYFISSLLYISFFYFFRQIRFVTEYFIFFIRFRWYSKNIIILNL
jgi:hypothetical protein